MHCWNAAQGMDKNGLITIIHAEAHVRTLARDLQGIGQAIAEIISSSTTTYAHKHLCGMHRMTSETLRR
jgi:hypothetical protein